ncbi:type VI secretion system baseplate subunit TssE [Insolitispirillum peregrinum]|uniref:Type VI secretion system protein ImpF n=1 Tax=Insolitispirillum peregrinum TaxID=80876 RepID=A0A1N7JGU8_9PROT|nr:type VI secretion system baseplate subunit TssE [Insolitispirillum peregrinum]SIS48484.1 type VI secretion system protein ImpF [Insolitispirillum peregrinum]
MAEQAPPRRSTYGPISGIPAAVDRRSLPGAPVPLLERLVDEQPGHTHEARPYRSFGIDGLMASVQAEISRLFNTRAPIAAAALRRWPRSVIDYGIPDFSTYAADGLEGHARFAREAEAALRAFEPRLLNPVVTVERDETTRLPRWLAVIEGVLASGALREPVHVRVALPDAGPAAGGE